MKATRVDNFHDLFRTPGAYMLTPTGWYAQTPNGLTGNLSQHQVTEHGDGTITVSPSILVQLATADGGALHYHGFLERGEWREC